ncbi:MAG: C1 family peptidase [Ignavibacteriaceae bacterium]|nr:C1 family peptidase [Ignavibacteriaceae bacterium]
MVKIILTISIILLFLNNLLFAQEEYGLGVLLDKELYVNSPTKAPLMRGDYNNLPPSHSLKKFTPTPKSQGADGTCAGWSTAYAGHTILEAINKGLQRDEIDSNAFSPSFVYNQIRFTKNCKGGTSLLDALNVLKDQGGVKFSDFGNDCDREVEESDIKNASEFRIIEYREISSWSEGNQGLFAKKSLSENRPVIAAMDCPPSFSNARSVWTPDSSEYKTWNRGHGIAVIGYDDNKYGGAFELMNSWGIYWGEDGYSWVRYSDYEFFVHMAFELIDYPKPEFKKPDLSGKLLFSETTEGAMKFIFNGEYFETVKPFTSGTLFELFVTNQQPAYVYAFSSDLTYKVDKIFPFNDKMSAYLPYSQNNVAIPSEESFNMLDDVKGITYYCFLYSKNKIAIDEKLLKIKNSEGNMWNRIKSAFGSELIESSKIKYELDEEIKFNAFSDSSTIIPIIIAIKHE